MVAIEEPSLTLYEAVLHALCSTDPRRDTVASAFDGLVTSFDERQAGHLGAVLGRILGLLVGDMDRLRFAASAIVQFDMSDTADNLVEVALGTRDRDLMLSAAAVCGNPAVGQGLRSKIEQELGGDRLALMRLRPDLAPETADEKILYQQCWPGTRRKEHELRLPPVVVLDKSLGARVVLLAALHIVRCGGVVRQLDRRAAVPDWFGPATVLVCTRTTLKAISPKLGDFSTRRILVDHKIVDDADIASLLRQINARLPQGPKLRLMSMGSENATEVWNPNVYGLGAYKTIEASYLTSAPARSLRSLVYMGVLAPRRIGRRQTPIWSFRDIVGVRAWRYMRSESRRQISPEVVKRLVEFTGSKDAVSVGVTSDGRVWSMHNGTNGDNHWVDILTGQRLMPMSIKELTQLDDVFSPFTLGGSSAPNLLRASENTRLHPATLNGQLYLGGYRIPANVLAELDRRGGRNSILAVYPELDGIRFDDTLKIGLRLVGSRP